MKLALVFPDAAPSRFRLAFVSGTVTSLESRLADARRGLTTDAPADAAERLLALVALLDTHDALTRGHSERVRAYSQSIGRELGLDRTELDLLNWAALLHDVGKLDVPREILLKRGKPTDEEWEALRGHPAAGARLASPLDDWLGEWGDAIEQHHERWDGRGYPNGLAGTEISLAGRIVAVADVFDVITSSRSYKEPSTWSAARMEITRCAGSQFDPDVVRAFLAISVRRSRLTAAAAWMANISVLARIPAPVASTVSAGAVAVGVSASGGVASHLDVGELSRPAGSPLALANVAHGRTSAARAPIGSPALPERRRAPIAPRRKPERAAPTRGPVRGLPPVVEAPLPGDTPAAPPPRSPDTTPIGSEPEPPGTEAASQPSAPMSPRPPEPPRRPELPAVPPVALPLPELPAVPPVALPLPELPAVPPVALPLPELPALPPVLDTAPPVAEPPPEGQAPDVSLPPLLSGLVDAVKGLLPPPKGAAASRP